MTMNSKLTNRSIPVYKALGLHNVCPGTKADILGHLMSGIFIDYQLLTIKMSAFHRVFPKADILDIRHVISGFSDLVLTTSAWQPLWTLWDIFGHTCTSYFADNQLFK